MRRVGRAPAGRTGANPRSRAAALARRRAIALWLRPVSRIGVALGAGAVVAGLPYWLWASGTGAGVADAGLRAALHMTAAGGLAVEDVLVEGRVNAPRQELLKAVGVKRGDPLLGFDIAQMRKRIEAVSWVRTAVIERRLPDMLYIRIVERVPMALWQREGRLMLVDRDGVVLQEGDPGRYRSLILVVGDDAPQFVPQLLGMLATEPGLARRVVAATRIGARRWNLRFDSGIDVRLPETDPGGAWARLADLERQQKLLQRDITAIDLRLPDRLVVQTRQDVRHQRRGGKDA